MNSENRDIRVADPLDKKLNEHFAGRVVRKDLTKLLKGGANVPVYVLEYLLGMYCASDDEETIRDGLQAVKRVLAENYVRPDEAEKVKSYIKERGSYKIIDKVTVTLNEKRDAYEALLSNLGTKGVNIPDGTVKEFEKLLAGGIWSIVTISYYYDESRKSSPFYISELKPIQMPNMDLDGFFEGRKHFSEGEWIDVLMRSSGMEPSELDERVKWHLLARMIPFVENNYNMCELGPRNTGKSHIYKELSPNSILVSGGQTTVANLFYNMASRTVGLVGFWDIVAFDEVAGIKFKDADGVQIMKDYMASGSFARGKDSVEANAAMVFVGNIGSANVSVENLVRTKHLLVPFPEVMIDPAFIDRFHAYIPGWEIPKLKPLHFTDHYGLIVDYLAEFFREMRKRNFQDAIDPHFTLNNSLNQRDTIAVRRSVSGLLKLLYPQGEYGKEAVRRCLEYALETRRRVKEQLLRIGGNEFKDVDLGYVDKEDASAHIISVPEYEGVKFVLEKHETIPTSHARSKDRAPAQTESGGIDTDHGAGAGNKGNRKVPFGPNDGSPVADLIMNDEHSFVEFKETMLCNTHTNKADPTMEWEVLRTVAGFMNSYEGGTLLIGVEDSEHKLMGLERDLRLIAGKNIDAFLLHLTRVLNDGLTRLAAMNSRSLIEAVDGIEVCRIDVRPSDKQVFVNAKASKNQDEFFIRHNNLTQSFSAADMLDYARARWPDRQ